MALKDYHKALGLRDGMTQTEIINHLNKWYKLIYEELKDKMTVFTFEGIAMVINGDDLESKIDNACQFLVIDEYRRQMNNKMSFQQKEEEDKAKLCSNYQCEGGCNLCESWHTKFKITQQRYDMWNHLGWIEPEFIYEIVDNEEHEKLVNEVRY